MLVTAGLVAQNESPEAPEVPLFERTILSDLETAGTSELLEWAVTLGLSAQGSRTEVEDRILEYYGLRRQDLAVPDEEEDRALSVATIRNARGSSYFTLEQTDERYLRLIGGVQLTMEDGESVHTITAEELTLNLEQNTISALGMVEYRVVRPDETEEFRGDSIVFNIRDWDGVFLRGITQSGQSLDEEEIDFTVSGERISRSPRDIVVIDNGVITSSRADPPNYRIRAQRIWILAPGEWGIKGAVLYVGRVPMFYFPYFFLPGDKLFFHPAIGSRSREGSFIQTTTYLFGQSDESDPPFSLMQIAESPEESERVIQGLFLRIPDEPKTIRYPEWSLKLMADIYTNLGYYAGAAGSQPDLGPFSQLDWRLGIGRSRNIYLDNQAYSSFYVDEMGNARQYWNNGYILDRHVPFRYELEFDAAIESSRASWTISYLALSDTRFRSDFGNRSEGIDWGFILNQTAEEEDVATSRDITSSLWETQLRWNPNVVSLSPWITSLRLSSLRGELQWNSRLNQEIPGPAALPQSNNSPEERFFYPQSAVLPDLSVEVQGTLLALPGGRDRREGSSETDSENNVRSETENDEEQLPRPPWEIPPERPASPDDEFILPDRPGTLPGIDTFDRGSLNLGYAIRPTLRIDRVTDNEVWRQPEEVRFNWLYSTLQSRTRGNMTLTAVSPGTWVRYQGTLTGENRYQSVDFVAAIEEQESERLTEAAFRFRGDTVDQRSSLTFYPFLEIDSLGASTLAYELSSLVYERSFDELSPTGTPEYATRWGEWSEEGISMHAGNATVRWNFLRSEQTLTTRAVLPPLDRAYTGQLNVVTGPLRTNLSGGYRETEERWIPDTFVQSHALTIVPDQLTVDQRLEYDLEENNLLQSRTIGRLWPLRLELLGRRTEALEFIAGEGWQRQENPAFRWTNLSIGLAAEPRYRLWRRRIELGLTGVLAYQTDLQQFTSSSLVMDYGFTLDIYRFLSLSLAARSRNDLVYQYIPAYAETVDRPQRDPLEDLINSLRIFDDEARQETFFKIESIQISAVHDLEDWDLTLSYNGGPELLTDGGFSRYEWQGVFAVLFRWKAISEIRRDISVEDGIVEFVES